MAGLIPFGTGFAFDNFFDEFFKPSAMSRANFAGFKMDVSENDKEYIIEADLPGIKKEDIALCLREGTLEIAVSCEEKTQEPHGAYLHRERRFSSCKRSVYLGDADSAAVSAKMEDGVLIVSVHKLSKVDTARNIEIS